MKFGDAFRAIPRPRKTPSAGTILRVLEVGAGAASALWFALRVRKQLYGPGGTKLNRYPPTRKKDRD
jgi:hypothetical protein